MNFAAVLKPDAPKPAKKEQSKERHLQPGWVNLREELAKPREEKEKNNDKNKDTDKDINDVDLDARFKRAAIEMRRRWDRWNAEHGIEYDYDQGSWSDTDDEVGDEAAWFEDENRSDEFYNDYCSTKKAGFSAT